jgi:DNA-binding SARP family transcriptional activator/tetratricopeptide (TPR) repeat protein
MDYRILGPLEIRARDRLVPLRGVRQRELMAVLLLRANEIVSSDRLIDELWEGDPPQTAAKMIQNGVSQLRKLIEPDVLVTRSPGYLLVVEPSELDADRFQRFVDEARAGLGAGKPAQAAEALREALGLWRGPALADCADIPYARAEAARLEELRSAATEDRIEAELELGRHADLVAELEALVAQHPLRERLRAQLMVALYRSGRQAEALRVYHETREILVEELGLEPGRALQRLERAVLVQDPALELSRDGAREPARDVASPRETRKTVSVVAADVLALGGPHDPEALRRPMSRAVETVTGVLERHGARTEASAAGGVIGIFGVPTVHEDDALRAVRAASEARDALLELRHELERDSEIAIALRSGVNTGDVVADAEARTLVAGDAVNVAARLQQAADPGEILLDEQTERLVRDAVRTERVDPDALRATGRGSAWRLLELAPEAPGYLRRLETPLVGRADELEQLQHCFERAVEQRTAKLFTILGPAGIGKTRLARELVRSVGERATVLQGHCPSYGEGITFWPLREIVGQVGDLSEALDGEADADAIADRILGAVGLSAHETTNEETFWAARKLFEAVARRRALVVLLEDAHWAEPALLDLVEHIVEWSSDAPIVFVCLGRSELVDERPRLAGGRANVSSVVLEPLSDRETDELIDGLRGDTELSGETRSRIAATAEGNPLFIEQMLAMVAEQGADGKGEAPIPPTIHALLAARLERLRPGERSILERGAVIGREFNRDALVELVPRQEWPAVGGALESLVRRELLRPVRDETFRFRHLLLLEVAYDAVPKLERADLHERHGDWVERQGGDEEIVGYHFERAHAYQASLGPVDAEGRSLARRAATRLGAAGRRAYERGDLHAAVGLLSRAADLVEPGAAGRVELLADLGEALRETGEFDRAESVLEEVIRTASAAGDDVLEARAQVIRLRLRLLTDPAVTEEVVRQAEPLIETFEQVGDDRLLAKAWELLAWAPWFRCQAAATVDALERAIEHARRAGDARTEAQSLNLSIGAAFFGPMPAPDAIRLSEQILADPVQQQRNRASALRALAGLKAMVGAFGEARELVDAHKTIVQELGLRVTAASSAETYGIVEMLAGDPGAAERELALGYGLLEEIGETQNFPDLAAKLADALYVQGQDDQALELSKVSEAATAPDDRSAGVQWRAVRAKLLARGGEPAAAEPLAREAVALADETDFTVLRADASMDLAEVLRTAGRENESRPFVAQALELYERKGNVVAAGRARRILDA